MIDELTSILNRRDVEWELYWEKGSGSSFRIERERLERSQKKFHSGVGLRIGYRGRLGFSYITGLNHDWKTLEEFVERTIKLARVSEVPFVGFPEPKKPPSVSGLYDKKIGEMSFDESYELASGFSELMRELKDDATLSGSLAFGINEFGVMNSNGVELEDRSTGMSFSVYAVLGTGTGSYYQSYRSLQPIEEMENGIREALRDARLSSIAKPLDGHSGEVLLEPDAFRALESLKAYLFFA
jgi:PmbA protein